MCITGCDSPHQDDNCKPAPLGNLESYQIRADLRTIGQVSEAFMSLYDTDTVEEGRLIAEFLQHVLGPMESLRATCEAYLNTLETEDGKEATE